MWVKRTHDEVTNPSARIRQEKPPRRPAVLWPNEPERPPTSDWAEMAVGQNKPRGRPRHARSQSLLPLGSIRLLAFRLKSLLYFSCCLQGRLFLCSLRLCAFSAFERTNPSQKPPVGKNPRREAHAPAELFWPNEPKEAARSAFGQTIPRGSPVTPVAKQTQAADQSASSPNEPDEQPSRSCFRQMNPRCSPVPV
jgi:hypothetical protein